MSNTDTLQSPDSPPLPAGDVEDSLLHTPFISRSTAAKRLIVQHGVPKPTSRLGTRAGTARRLDLELGTRAHRSMSVKERGLGAWIRGDHPTA